MSNKLVYLVMFMGCMNIQACNEGKKCNKNLKAKVRKGYTVFDFGRADTEKKEALREYGAGYLVQAVLRHELYHRKSALFFFHLNANNCARRQREIHIKYVFAGEVANNFIEAARNEIIEGNFVILPDMELIKGNDKNKDIITDVIIAGTQDDKGQFQQHYNADIQWLLAYEKKRKNIYPSPIITM